MIKDKPEAAKTNFRILFSLPPIATVTAGFKNYLLCSYVSVKKLNLYGCSLTRMLLILVAFWIYTNVIAGDMKDKYIFLKDIFKENTGPKHSSYSRTEMVTMKITLQTRKNTIPQSDHSTLHILLHTSFCGQCRTFSMLKCVKSYHHVAWVRHQPLQLKVTWQLISFNDIIHLFAAKGT